MRFHLLLKRLDFFVSSRAVELTTKLGEQSLRHDSESVCTLPYANGSITSGFGDATSEQRRRLPESMRKGGLTVLPLRRFLWFTGDWTGLDRVEVSK